jgi:uncharacterized protein YigA (DUF484 family)
MSDDEVLDEAGVMAWLDAHPDALARNPELLARLELRHETNAGSSLIEHQVAVLRDQVTAQRDKLRRYHEAAELNEALFRRLHDLYVAMIEADSTSDLVALVSGRLRDDFDCQEVLVGHFGSGPSDASLASLAAVRSSFEAIIAGGEPVCGRLSTSRLEALFPAEANASIRSAALVPWGIPVAGMLVLGSHDERKFYPGMGTLFLEFLGKMLGQRLEALAVSSEAHPG